MATIQDVAKQAGVSATTAKRAIHEPHLLSSDTLKRVQDAIAALQYEPNLTAGALRRGHSHAIGFLVGSIVEPFFAELARHIGARLRQHKYAMLLADSEYNTEVELEYLKQFSGQNIAGLIIRPGYGTDNVDYLLRMQERGTKIIQIDHHLPSAPFGYVMLDNRQSVFTGVEHLVRSGHTRIAGLGMYDPERLSEGRTLAFPEAMQHYGLSIPSEYQKVIDLSEEDAYRLTYYLMSLPENIRPTALFAFTGAEGVGAFKALRELNLCIPDDVALLTFDNYAWTQVVNPPIDCIAQPVEDMADMAVNYLLNSINGTEPELLHYEFSGKLMVRGSCVQQVC